MGYHGIRFATFVDVTVEFSNENFPDIFARLRLVQLHQIRVGIHFDLFNNNNTS